MDTATVPPRAAANFVPKWVYFVRVCSFTFEFHSVAHINECFQYYSRKTHSFETSGTRDLSNRLTYSTEPARRLANVAWDSSGTYYDAEIVWNNGARLFAVHAGSLTDALNFEASYAWVDGPCWDARSW